MPDDLGRHLWSIVGPDVFRDTPDQHHVRHSLNHTQTVDPAGNTDRQAFPRELVDQCHKPNLAAIMRLGFDKVVRPDVVSPITPGPSWRWTSPSSVVPSPPTPNASRSFSSLKCIAQSWVVSGRGTTVRPA